MSVPLPFAFPSVRTAAVLCLVLCTAARLQAAGYTGPQLRTIEYNLGGSSNTTLVASGTQLFAGSTWHAAEASAGTKSVKIAGTGIKVRSATLQYVTTRATHANVTRVRLTIKTSPGVAAGMDLPAVNDTYQISSGLSQRLVVHADATAAFQAQTDANWAAGVAVSATATVTGPSVVNSTLKLLLTYESDYAITAHDEVKTVRLSLRSTAGTDAGSTQAAVGFVANPDATFAYEASGNVLPDLLADADIYDVFFEVTGQADNNAVAGTMRLRVGATGTYSPGYPTNGYLGANSDVFVTFRPAVGAGNFQRAAQQLQVDLVTANALSALGGELVLTYKFSTGAASQAQTVRYVLGQGAASGVVNPNLALDATKAVAIANRGMSVKNAFLRVQSNNTAPLSVSVLTTVGAAAEVTKTYALTGANAAVGRWYVVQDLSANAAALLSGANVRAKVRYSAAGGGPPAAELFVTFTWAGSGESGTQTKTVEFPVGQTSGARDPLADYQSNQPVQTVFPELVPKTLRSAHVLGWVQTSKSTSITTPTVSTLGINGGLVSGGPSWNNDSRGFTVCQALDATALLSVFPEDGAYVVNRNNNVAADISVMSGTLSVTYDAAFSGAWTTKAEKQGRTIEYNVGGSSDATLRTTTTRVHAGSSWNTAEASAGTRTVKINGTGIRVRSAMLQYMSMRATDANVTRVRLTVKTSPGETAGMELPAVNSLYHVSSGEAQRLVVCADATAAFQAQSDADWAAGVAVSASVTVDGPSVANGTMKLLLTYEADYTTLVREETKTVRLPLRSLAGTDSGSTQAAVGFAASPDATFAYDASGNVLSDLVASANIHDAYFELTGLTDNNAASGTMRARVGAGGSYSPSWPTNGYLGGKFDHAVTFSPGVGPTGFLPAAQQLQVDLVTANSLSALGGELVVTYSFTTGRTGRVETVRYLLGQGASSGVASPANALDVTKAVAISNKGLSVKHAWLRVQSNHTKAVNVTVGSTVGTSAEVTKTYALTGSQPSVGRYVILHDLTPNKASLLNGSNVRARVQYSGGGGGPPSAELLVTFAWDGSWYSGTQTKTVEYPLSQPNGSRFAAADHQSNLRVNLAFPETADKTLRSAFVAGWLQSCGPPPKITDPTVSTLGVNGGLVSGGPSWANETENFTICQYLDASAAVSVADRAKAYVVNRNNNAAGDVTVLAGTVVVTYDAAFPTAVALASFGAAAAGGAVELSWRTASEVRNLGFNILRSTAPDGGFVRVNRDLIPGLRTSAVGRAYAYRDADAPAGVVCYYLLEDVDTDCTATRHGPVAALPGSADVDRDGLPDDWERAHGLDPAADDAGLDPDGDGLANRAEFDRGSDPAAFDPGAARPPAAAAPATPELRTVSATEERTVLEFTCPAWSGSDAEAGGKTWTALTVPGCAASAGPGAPRLPLRGWLVAVPAGRTTTLRVIDCDTETAALRHPVLPVPDTRADGLQVAQDFAWDEAAYRTGGFLPQAVAELGPGGRQRGEQVVQVLFRPVQYDAAAGELRFHGRIRVALDHGLGRHKDGDGTEEAAAVSIWSPATPSLKVAVDADGLYEVSAADLRAAGVDPAGVDPRTFRLWNLGRQVAVSVSGEADGAFDAGDRLRFLGQAPASAFTRTNVYWLDWGVETGQRMAVRDGAAPALSAPEAFADTRNFERDLLYWDGVPAGDGKDHWFWALAEDSPATPANCVFTLRGLSTEAGTAVIRTTVFGLTRDDAARPDHRATFTLNGNVLGTAEWDGQAEQEFSAACPQSWLREGDNTLAVSAGGTDAAYDACYVNRLGLDFRRGVAAEGDSLRIVHSTPAAARFAASGFSSNVLLAFDVTDPGAPAAIAPVLATSAAGGWTAGFGDALAAPRTILVLAAPAVKAPLSVTLDAPSRLAGADNGADHIMIVHDAFVDAVAPLARLRDAQGLRVAVVKVSDVYDEFAYGLATPRAIRDFLAHAYRTWTPPAPAYALLVGDANFDARDNLGTGVPDYVPTHLLWTPLMGETAGDNWFACVDGNDSLPDLHIGRLPARSAGEAAAMAAKIVAYEAAGAGAAWNRRVILAADDADEEWETGFEAEAEAVAATLPAPYAAERIYVGASPAGAAAGLKAGLDAGALVVDYVGHGAVDFWASERILDNAAVATLANAGRLPFVVDMTCLTGWFQYPAAYECLAERLLRATDTGAVAVFSPSGLGLPDGHRIMNEALHRAIFSEDARTLGQATTRAKAAVLANDSGRWWDTVETQVLFGDPAMTLALPTPRAPLGLAAAVAGRAAALSWRAGDGQAPAGGYRVWRATSREPAWVLLGAATAASWSDPVAPAPEVRRYRVTALDAGGLESPPSAEAAVDLAALPFLVTAAAGPGGVVAPAGQVEVAAGASLLVAIAAHPGWHLDSLVVDGQAVAPAGAWEFTGVDADHAVTASFAEDLKAKEGVAPVPATVAAAPAVPAIPSATAAPATTATTTAPAAEEAAAVMSGGGGCLLAPAGP